MALRCAISLKGVTQVAIAQRTPVKSADRALAIVEQRFFKPRGPGLWYARTSPSVRSG